jgi:hypothetical protein
MVKLTNKQIKYIINQIVKHKNYGAPVWRDSKESSTISTDIPGDRRIPSAESKKETKEVLVR